MLEIDFLAENSELIFIPRDSDAEQDELEMLNSDNDYAILMAEHAAEFDAQQAQHRYQNWLIDNGITEQDNAQYCCDWCEEQDY